MYMLSYSHERKVQRLECMCHYTAMKVGSKGKYVCVIIQPWKRGPKASIYV